MISPRFRLLAAFGLVLASACDKKAAPKTPLVPVTVATAETRAVPYELAATGTVEPIQTVAVFPQVTAPILRIPFREGQDVKKGQVLFELDPRPFQAALNQAQGILARDRATAANAEEQAKRYASLAAKEYVTAEQNDAARSDAMAASATVAASQAGADQARLNLQYATIRAPISGRTGSLRVREGNLVRSTDTSPLVTINQIQPILVRFAVPAKNLPAIQKYRSNRMAVFASPTGGGSESQGTLAFVDNAVDTSTGTILLKGSFPNSDGALWPGEFVNVRLRLYVDENALVVPASAVVAGQQGSIVFVVQTDSSAATKKVTVRRTAGNVAIVDGDIKPGDRVVTDGQLRLRQGAKVQIKSRGDSARTSQGAS
ncbi:MAG TPA: efflux RND transporter periplasmic adaptor subunit [Gemmatimonadales bacterium]|jgi:multidrug efflux system membrane fusion protein|nr:efflux RND transporter periplasmic adaptor subunit [Gemmatimonadales bacterium]